MLMPHRAFAQLGLNLTNTLNVHEVSFVMLRAGGVECLTKLIAWMAGNTLAFGRKC
jgi:hypothetical protein